MSTHFCDFSVFYKPSPSLFCTLPYLFSTFLHFPTALLHFFTNLPHLFHPPPAVFYPCLLSISQAYKKQAHLI